MWWNTCLNPTLMKKNKSYQKLQEQKNNQILQLIFNRYYCMAKCRYDIINLPEQMNKRVIMDSLLWNATVFPFNYMGCNMALPGTTNAKYNIYMEQSGAHVYGFNGWNKEIDLIIPGSEECELLKQTTFYSNNESDMKGVMVRENDQMFPFINTVIYYAEQVADTLRTLDIQKQHLKNPYIIFCEESMKKEVIKWQEQIDDNQGTIISTGIFPVDKVRVENITANGQDINAVIGTIEWLDNQFKALCGIETNGAIDKKGENLIQPEIDIQQDYTNKNVQLAIDKLNEGFDLYNKIFGTNIKVVPYQQKEENKDDDLFGLSNKEPKSLSKS